MSGDFAPPVDDLFERRLGQQITTVDPYPGQGVPLTAAGTVPATNVSIPVYTGTDNNSLTGNSSTWDTTHGPSVTVPDGSYVVTFGAHIANDQVGPTSNMAIYVNGVRNTQMITWVAAFNGQGADLSKSIAVTVANDGNNEIKAAYMADNTAPANGTFSGRWLIVLRTS